MFVFTAAKWSVTVGRGNMQKGRHKEVLFFCPTVGGARTVWPGLREAPRSLQSPKKIHTQGEYLTTRRDFNSGRGHDTEQPQTRSVLHQNKTNQITEVSSVPHSVRPRRQISPIYGAFSCCVWCINWEINEQICLQLIWFRPPFWNLRQSYLAVWLIVPLLALFLLKRI